MLVWSEVCMSFHVLLTELGCSAFFSIKERALGGSGFPLSFGDISRMYHLTNNKKWFFIRERPDLQLGSE